MKNIEGQITFTEYLKSKRKIFPSCEDCVCQNCLYWWSKRCPYGDCYDDKRAVDNPYDKAHPDKPPRTAWSNWKTDQAFWCRGGFFYTVSYCEHFVKYKGQQVKECLKCNVQVFQDGYIYCSMVETMGCEACYEEFQESEELKEQKRCESLTEHGCKARESARELMFLEQKESHERTEICKKQCCEGCEETCGYRCGKC